jgi:hypothetical protein
MADGHSDVTRQRASRAQRVTGHPGVRFTFGCWAEGGETLQLSWKGSAEDLIAAGVATADMLTTVGGFQVDSAGDKYHIDMGAGLRNGKPYARYTVTRWKAREVALSMAGVSAFFAALEPSMQPQRAWERLTPAQREQWWHEWARAKMAGEPPPPYSWRAKQAGHPALRLVVDNTRSTPVNVPIGAA